VPERTRAMNMSRWSTALTMPNQASCLEAASGTSGRHRRDCYRPRAPSGCSHASPPVAGRAGRGVHHDRADGCTQGTTRGRTVTLLLNVAAVTRLSPLDSTPTARCAMCARPPGPASPGRASPGSCVAGSCVARTDSVRRRGGHTPAIRSAGSQSRPTGELPRATARMNSIQFVAAPTHSFSDRCTVHSTSCAHVRQRSTRMA
jgi:hypothetical protein